MGYKWTVERPEKQSVYDFRATWDEDAIREAMAASAKEGIPPFELSKVELQPVKVCQLDCPWCFGRYLRMPEDPGSREAGGDAFLPLDKVERNLFAPLRGAGLNPVFMLAGLYSDPLAYPRSADLMAAIGRYGFRFGLYTNGLGMTDDVIDSVVAHAGVRDSMPSYVSIDVGALLLVKRFEEVFPRIRRLLRERNPRTLQVNAPIVLNDYLNGDEPVSLEQVHALLMEAGVDAIRYNFAVMPVKPGQQRVIDRVAKLEKASGGRAKLETKNFTRCYVLTQSLTVHATGKVFPCSQTCSTAFDSLSFGNINDQSILEIWQGAKHKALFQRFNPAKSHCRCNVGDARFNEFAGDVALSQGLYQSADPGPAESVLDAPSDLPVAGGVPVPVEAQP